MMLSELQSLIGSLTNDPNHDRYSTSDINTELDNTQTTWNLEAKLIKDTSDITLTENVSQYALTDLTGTPISFPRTTLKGIDLAKRSKAYFDHMAGRDWTQDIGTPNSFYVEATDPANLYITIYPLPQSGDVDSPLVVEYIKAHTPMSASTDVPFMSGTSSNYLLRPYDWGLCYSVAAKLLLRDPNEANALKSTNYATIARNVLAEVVQVFKQLEAEEPKSFRYWGGRPWVAK